MTTLREAATQALEAMEGGSDSWQLVGPAIDALKEALVEDAMQKFTDVNQELEAALGCGHCNQPLYAAVKCRVCGRVTEPVQEPVAWMYQNKYTDQEYLVWKKGTGGRNWRPLFTAPPQRKPLSEEEIKQLLFESAGMTVTFSAVDLSLARAIERAHGIK